MINNKKLFLNIPGYISAMLLCVLSISVNAAPTVQLDFLNRFGKAPSTAPGEMNYPSAVAVDQNTGDLYVMDVLYQRVQKFDSSGNYITHWQSINGLGISVDMPTGDVYVASPGDHKVRKYTSSGGFILEWGGKGAGPGQFNSPRSVAVHPVSGNVYVLDDVNARVQVFDSNGVYLFEWAGNIFKAYALTIDTTGSFVYIANSGGANILKYDDQGNFLATWGSLGSAPGEFRWPRGIDTDAQGNIFVADADMERLQKLNTLGQSIQVIQGPHNMAEGPFHPRDVAVDKNTGEFYAAAAYAFRVDKFDANGNYMWSIGHLDRDGSFLNLPKGIALDPTNGNVIVADTFNHMVKRFSSDGVFLAQYGASAPIDRSLRYLGFPNRVDVDNQGNIVGINEGIFYPDDLEWGSDEYIRTYDSSYNYISGFAYDDFNAGMYGLDIESGTNNVFVSITKENKVAKFDPFGTLLFEVGAVGSAPGNFLKPGGIAEDPLTGGFYVADSGNQRIQKFSKDGVFLLEWGVPGNGPGELNLSPNSDIDVDHDGLIYVADTRNSRVQVFDIDGTHLASLGVMGWGGAGKFAWPASLVVSPDNKLYVLDTGGKEIEIYNIIKSGIFDRDLDGMSDAWELAHFQTLDRDGNGDFEGDGLTDKQEHDLSIDPTLSDTDLDLMPDGWEVAEGLNPALVDDQDDPDGDGFTNYEEYIGGTQPLNAASLPNGVRFEIGEMTVSGGAFKSITLPGGIPNPVVIVGPASSFSTEPGVVAINNVNSGGFDVKLKEWNYLNGEHPAEKASFMVWREGRFSMPDGAVIEVGKFNTGGAMALTAVPFDQSFAGVPNVFLTPQTSNGADTIAVRALNLTSNGFDVLIQEQESKTDGHIDETIGYVAIYNPAGSGDIEVDQTLYSYSLSVQQISDVASHVVGDLKLRLEEERSADNETWHKLEDVHVMTIQGQVFAQVASNNGTDPVTPRLLVERVGAGPGLELLAGSLVGSQQVAIGLNAVYESPVVISSVASSNDQEPGMPSIQSVGSGSFQAAFDEWNYLDNLHAPEEVDFLASESGRTIQADGTVVEAGSFELDGVGAFKKVYFQEKFINAPYVFLAVQTRNGQDRVVVRSKNVAPDGFDAALFEEEALMGGYHAFENVGYIAVMPAGSNVDMISAGITVAGTLTKIETNHTPLAVTGGKSLYLQEEASSDVELLHTNEKLNVLYYGDSVFAQEFSVNGIDTVVPRLQ